MFKFRSLQKRLFISHIATIIIFSLISGVTFFLYTSSVIHNNVLGTDHNMVKSTSNQLDLFVRDMDNLSRNILFSRVYYDSDMFYYLQDNFDLFEIPKTNYMSDYFFSNPFENPSDNKYQLYALLQDRNIVNVITSLNGPEMRTNEIVLFDRKGIFFGAPESNTFNKQELQQIISNAAWIDRVFEKKGKKEVLPPHASDWSSDNQWVISLVRSFSDTRSFLNTGIIEVQQNYTKLENIINLVTADKHNAFYVFDNNNQLIYPAIQLVSGQDPVNDNFNYLREATSDKESNQKQAWNPNSKKNETLLYNYSAYTGWTTIYAVPDHLLYSQTNKFRLWFLTVLIVVLTATFIFAYFASRSITYPMKLLHRFIKKTDMSNLLKESANPKLESGIEEVSEIYATFNDVRLRLNTAMNENIEARSNEAKAHWMALQAQMNPHFLYNTLAVLAVTSEEGGMHNVSDMCRKLSSMLKYVTNFTDIRTTLEHEVDYMNHYLELMKFRYEEHLAYNIDIPADMMDIAVPKLVLQPLIENCINHGFSDSRPPWNISVYGRMDRGSWTFTVADNGCGMALNKLDEISEEIVEYDNSNAIRRENTSESGLGLMNTLKRLKFMYKDSFYFKLENNDNGGLSVTFGGSFQEVRQENIFTL
jgi:two-component system sensor histidine kinase YesM